jgi:outer membrane protein
MNHGLASNRGLGGQILRWGWMLGLAWGVMGARVAVAERPALLAEFSSDSLPLEQPGDAPLTGPPTSSEQGNQGLPPLDPLPTDHSPSDGATTIALSLADLLNLTLAGNRNWQNSILERIVQRQRLTEAEQAFDPRLVPSLSASVTRQGSNFAPLEETSPGLVGFERDRTRRDSQALLETLLTTRQGTAIRVGLDPLNGDQPLAVQIRQPLLRGFGTAINEAPIHQARLEESRNQLALQTTVIDLVTTAITEYTNLINTQTQVEIQAQALDRRQRQLEILQALVRAGRQAEIVLFDTERSVADAERNLVDAQNQLLQANNRLLNLIGTDQNLRFVASPAIIDGLFETAVAQVATYDREVLVQTALQRQGNYRQAQLERQQLALALQVAQDNLRWQVDAVANSTLGQTASGTLGLVATRSFDDPLLETNRVRSEISLQQQDNTLAQLQETIRNDVTASLADVQSNQQRVLAAERATLSARRQLQADQEQYRLGRDRITLFQIIDREEALVTAQTNELEARIAFLNSIAALERTVGITLDRWVDQIDRFPLTETLDPEVTPSPRE